MTDPNWPRPADEPRSQPFQPVSYSFEPEFTPPPAPPPVAPPPPPQYQQPVYQQQPPPHPMYQQPVYQQPAVPVVPAQAYLRQPPPKPRRRRLKVTLWIIGTLSVLGTVALCVGTIPLVNAYGATVSAPDQLPEGLSKTTDSAMRSTIDDLKTQLNSDLGTSSAVAGYYDTTSGGHAVLFAAASTLIFSPGSQLDSAFKGLNSSLPVTDVQSYAAGRFGGTVKCGSSTSSGVKMALCGWADHGTVGIAAMLARSPAEAAPLFVKIREATESG